MGAGRGLVGIAWYGMRGRTGTAWRRRGGRAGVVADMADMAAQPAHFVVGVAPRTHRIISQGTIAREGGPLDTRLGWRLFRRRCLGGRREAWRHGKSKGNSKSSNFDDRPRRLEVIVILRSAIMLSVGLREGDARITCL